MLAIQSLCSLSLHKQPMPSHFIFGFNSVASITLCSSIFLVRKDALQSTFFLGIGTQRLFNMYSFIGQTNSTESVLLFDGHGWAFGPHIIVRHFTFFSGRYLPFMGLFSFFRCGNEFFNSCCSSVEILVAQILLLGNGSPFFYD